MNRVATDAFRPSSEAVGEPVRYIVWSGSLYCTPRVASAGRTNASVPTRAKEISCED